MSPKTGILLILSLATAFAQTPADKFYEAIRNDDLAALRTLLTTADANTKDPKGQTPLMYAAAFGSLEVMKQLISRGADANATSEFGISALHWSVSDINKVRVLIEHGANVNAVSQAGRTPLLVAASTHGASEVVKLLLAKGAQVNIADGVGLTPLIAAANVDDTASAALLLEKGAEVNAVSTFGQTALMNAATYGNVALTKMLLARKADVNAASGPDGGTVKQGKIALGYLTPLLLASVTGGADVVKLLLDAGAKVDLQDVRGMTALMSAVSTDRPDVRVVKLLMDKGADPSIRSKTDESTLDWARKFNNPAVLAALHIEGSKIDARLPVTSVKLPTPREAVEKSMPLLQRSTAGVFTDGGCVACHAQPISGMAVDLARAKGWRVDEKVADTAVKELKTLREERDQVLLQGRESGGQPDSLLYSALLLAAERVPANRDSDTLVYYLAAKQRSTGQWAGGGATRAPMQDGNFSRTAMSIRALSVFGIPARKAEIAERISRAAAWLAAQVPLTTEDRVMQLLGLKWANANASVREARVRELIAAERSDGGWAQTPFLQSDAYATGQVLFTLRELGVPSSDTALWRGTEFLLRTQADDGTWMVKSRAMKIQPYFQSGFPYGHDQWISAVATGWAAMALSLTETEPSLAVR